MTMATDCITITGRKYDEKFYRSDRKKSNCNRWNQRLGRGMAEGLMEAGAEVVIVGSSDKVYTVAEEFVKNGFQCHGVVANLGDAQDRARGFEEAVKKLGDHLDILVNAAGVQRRHPSEEFPVEDYNYVIEVNQNAVFDWCQRAAKKYMAQDSKGKLH